MTALAGTVVLLLAACSSEDAAPRAHDLLLSASQLPEPGWTPLTGTDPESSEPPGPTQPECSNQSRTLRTAEMTGTASAAWKNESDVGVESVSSHAFVYTDAAAATSALASYRDLVSRCTRWENGKSPSGRPATFGEQELFDAPAGEESVARQSGIVHPYFTDIPTFRTYWVASRVGQSIVQITYDPEWPLDTKQGREKANGLAAVAAANVENHSE